MTRNFKSVGFRISSTVLDRFQDFIGVQTQQTHLIRHILRNIAMPSYLIGLEVKSEGEQIKSKAGGTRRTSFTLTESDVEILDRMSAEARIPRNEMIERILLEVSRKPAASVTSATKRLTDKTTTWPTVTELIGPL